MDTTDKKKNDADVKKKVLRLSRETVRALRVDTKIRAGVKVESLELCDTFVACTQ